MSNAISKSERGGKTVYIEKVGVFYDQQSGEIHLSVPGTDWFITTVSNKPGSAREHKNLYAKLARALKEAGAPGPDIDGREISETCGEMLRPASRSLHRCDRVPCPELVNSRIAAHSMDEFIMPPVWDPARCRLVLEQSGHQ